MAEIQTIIQLRNDTADAWDTEAGKATPLMPGEAAAVFTENGKVKLMIGANKENGTFADALQVGGEEAQVFQSASLASTNGDDDIDVINGLTTGKELHAGDMAVVKRYLKGESGAISYTSYVYDPTIDSNVKWIAMDGNYSAENVFFKEDILLAGNYTAVGNVTKSSNAATANLEVAGKSLADIMTSIFTKEIKDNLANTSPSTSINATKDVYLEIGKYSTAQTVTLSLNKGSYDNGYGYVVSKDEENIADGTSAVTVVTNDGTGVVANQYYFNGTAQDTNSFSVASIKKDEKGSETIKGKISYKNAGNPVSNIKKIYPSQALADSTTSEVSATLNKWYVPFYQGFTYSDSVIADPANITATQLTTGLSAPAAKTADNKVTSSSTAVKNINGDAYDKKKCTAAAASKAWRQYFLAYPTSYSYDMSAAKDSNGIDCTVNKANEVELDINGNKVKYTVYYINNAADYDTLGITWTLD